MGYVSCLFRRHWFVVRLALVGCGGPGSVCRRCRPRMLTHYTLGPGDQVRIITFGEENLTGEFRVNDSGNIALPLVGAVHAAGLTSGELEAAVAAALRQGNLVHNPSVAVEVIAYRPIYVLGEVNKPGQYPLSAGHDGGDRRGGGRRLHLPRGAALCFDRTYSRGQRR